MENFLGYDCANKSLAWSYITIDTEIYSKLAKLGDELTAIFGGSSDEAIRAGLLVGGKLNPAVIDIVDRILEATGKFITIRSMGVKDILLGKAVKTTDEMERTQALYNFVTSSNIKVSDIARDKPTVLIEHQPNKIGSGPSAKTNNKSTAVAYQLAFYYIELGPKFVDPKLKNNITLSPNLSLDAIYKSYSVRYKNKKDAKYKARKDQSKLTFVRLCDAFGLTEYKKIPKTYLDDVADSFMQIYVYVRDSKLYR
jgi:hypothetical protein